jgi:hypothetical protein
MTTTYAQETDSILAFAGPDNFSIELASPDETIANNIFDSYSPLSGETDAVEEGWSLLRRIRDHRELADQCEDLLNTIEELVLRVQSHGFDAMALPRLHAFLTEDSSVLFEWIFPDCRIGFTIEANASESGWYLVAKRTGGEIFASGALSEIELDSIISWLFSFISTHY